jgi:hypothetical protein
MYLHRKKRKERIRQQVTTTVFFPYFRVKIDSLIITLHNTDIYEYNHKFK